MAETRSEDIQAALEKQVAELKREIARISKSMSDRSSEGYDSLRDQADHAYHEATRRARRTAAQVRDQAHTVTEAVRENPGTAATLLTIVGVVGLAAGILIGQSQQQEQRRRWY
ncbi:DUF883 family protein [Limoniibacter endophyticus]|uniref:ElaB/YqjD/DUF883 family membrane-anchored ribosome-binding protein n=1 Tax=Limoniibacter endophyticus TaxID=1565040 RepID=A0A8J3DL68_9HYPH|nr:DUF883 family protein [Limoniibacter endophyticus]GHC63082.1 hypothetical protein GCM10010136_04600 [Limoniibacter endophyticus]